MMSSLPKRWQEASGGGETSSSRHRMSMFIDGSSKRFEVDSLIALSGWDPRRNELGLIESGVPAPSIVVKTTIGPRVNFCKTFRLCCVCSLHILHRLMFTSNSNNLCIASATARPLSSMWSLRSSSSPSSCYYLVSHVSQPPRPIRFQTPVVHFQASADDS